MTDITQFLLQRIKPTLENAIEYFHDAWKLTGHPAIEEAEMATRDALHRFETSVLLGTRPTAWIRDDRHAALVREVQRLLPIMTEAVRLAVESGDMDIEVEAELRDIRGMV